MKHLLCRRCATALSLDLEEGVTHLQSCGACESCSDDAFHEFTMLPSFDSPSDFCRARRFHVCALHEDRCRTCGQASPTRFTLVKKEPPNAKKKSDVQVVRRKTVAAK